MRAARAPRAHVGRSVGRGRGRGLVAAVLALTSLVGAGACSSFGTSEGSPPLSAEAGGSDAQNATDAGPSQDSGALDATVDAVSDAGPDATTALCPTGTCTNGGVCCAAGGQQTCTDVGSCKGIPFTCGADTNCGIVAKPCCFDSQGSACSSNVAACGSGSWRVCNTVSDCSGEQICAPIRCQEAGSTTQFTYGHACVRKDIDVPPVMMTNGALCTFGD